MDQKFSRVMLLTPISLLYMLLIGGGFFIVIKESFGIIPNIGFNQLTWTYYYEVITDESFVRSIFYSLMIAFTASFVSMVVGTLIAYRMTYSNLFKSLSGFRLGMVLPYLYMVFLVMLFLSGSGVVSRIMHHIGWISSPNEFPNLIYGWGGIALVFILKGIPFVTLLVFNVMGRINEDYNDVAMTLGSDRLNVFRRIYLPLSQDTIVWSGMVLFAYDLGSFEVPYILTQVRQQSFSVKLYSEYLSPSIESVPVTMAMTVILFLVGIVSIVIYGFFMRGMIRRLQR